MAPFIPQNQGNKVFPLSDAILIPMGKAKPRERPRGKSIATELAIFIQEGKAPKYENKILEMRPIEATTPNIPKRVFV